MSDLTASRLALDAAIAETQATLARFLAWMEPGSVIISLDSSSSSQPSHPPPPIPSSLPLPLPRSDHQWPLKPYPLPSANVTYPPPPPPISPQPHFLPNSEHLLPTSSPPINVIDLQKSPSNGMILEKSPSDMQESPSNLQESHSLPTEISKTNSALSQSTPQLQNSFSTPTPPQSMFQPPLPQTPPPPIPPKPTDPPPSDVLPLPATSPPKSSSQTLFTNPQQRSSLSTDLHNSVSPVNIVPDSSAIIRFTPPPQSQPFSYIKLYEKRVSPIKIGEKQEQKPCSNVDSFPSHQIPAMETLSHGLSVRLYGEPPPETLAGSYNHLRA